MPNELWICMFSTSLKEQKCLLHEQYLALKILALELLFEVRTLRHLSVIDSDSFNQFNIFMSNVVLTHQ